MAAVWNNFQLKTSRPGVYPKGSFQQDAQISSFLWMTRGGKKWLTKDLRTNDPESSQVFWVTSVGIGHEYIALT